MLYDVQSHSAGTNQILSLVDLIYSAATDVSLWPAVLDGISDAAGGVQTIFWATFHGAGAPPAFCSRGTAPEVLPLYSTHYHTLNVLAEPCDRMFRTGTARYSHLAMTDGEFERSEFYNDFFGPLDMHYSCGIKIPLDGEFQGYLTSQRAKRLGPFEETEGGALETLMPHLQRSLGLHTRLAQMQSHILGMEAALDAFEHAVLGLGCDGKVVLVSREAGALLRAGDGIRISNGELSTRDAAQNAHLKAAIAEAVRCQFATSSVSASILIRRRSGAPLQLTIIPHRSSLPGRSALAALIFIGDPARRSPSKAALLRALYGLSPAEARIADLLAEGLTVREIADRLTASLETTRFHTKKILAKTGARRQAELMRLMVALPSV